MTEHSRHLLVSLLRGPMHYIEFYRRDGILLTAATPPLAIVDHKEGIASLTDDGRKEAEKEMQP